MSATPKVEADTCSNGDEWRGDIGAESDVYESLFALDLDPMTMTYKLHLGIQNIYIPTRQSWSL